MANKWDHDDIKDYGLNYLKATVGANAILVLLAGDPGDQAADGTDSTGSGYASATTAYDAGTNYHLGQDTSLDLSSLTFNDDSVLGRKVDIPARTGILISTAGVATHVGIVDPTQGTGVLIFVSKLTTATQVYTGESVPQRTWKIAIHDVTQ